MTDSTAGNDGTAEVPTAVYAALQASGFPFQTAIEHVIRNTADWQVLGVEFPWRDRDGNDQFLDLVAGCGRYSVGMECKKTQKDTLTFLLPQGSAAAPVDRAWLLSADQVHDSSRRWELCFGLWRIAPPSYESAFCVVSTSGSGKDQRLLERDVGRLVVGTDAYAQRRLLQIPKSADDELSWPFVPVLVTNARLYVAHYDPTEISLQSGEFTAVPKGVTEVTWVRFRKSFPSSAGKDVGDRTAFVVNAHHLSQFLVQLGEALSAPPAPGTPRIHLPRASQ